MTGDAAVPQAVSAMNFGLDEAAVLGDVLKWRRDVRHFRTDPIDEALLGKLQTAMDLAPSVGNSRPWRVIRVKDQALRSKVRSIFDVCNEDAAESYESEVQAAYRALKLAGLDRAPEQLAVFTEIEPVEGRGLGRRTMPETLTYSTVMAIHTLWLAARVQNLGLGWVSILDPKSVEEAFDAPPHWRFTAYLCLGWPEHHSETPLLHASGWQENVQTVWEQR